MIGSTGGSHGSFSNVVGYALKAEKTEMYETLNLMSTEAEDIAKEMKDTVKNANDGRRVQNKAEKPTYHISFSWAEGDNPTRDDMLAFGRDFVSHMGLDTHQVVIAIHEDHEIDHIHIVANKMNPETEKMWDGWVYKENEQGKQVLVARHHERVEKFEREYEQQKGWRLTPGRFSGELGKEFDGYRPTQGQYHYGKRLELVSQQLPEHIRLKTVRQRAGQLKDELYQAGSLREFDNILASQNLYIESKGQGAVITDGNYAVKASSVSRGFSGSKLEGRFGESLKDYEAAREKEVDVGKGKEMIRDWTSATERVMIGELSQTTRRGREAVEADLAELQKYDSELGGIQSQIKEAFRETFKNPGEAWAMFGKYEQRYSYEQAGELMVSEPERFGQVKDLGGVVKVSEAIRSLDRHYESYPQRLTAMNPEQRKQYGEQLTSEKSVWNRIDRAITSAKSLTIGEFIRRNQIPKGVDPDKLDKKWLDWPKGKEKPVFNFGKMKGKDIDQVINMEEDQGYIAWMQTQGFPPEVMKIITDRQAGKQLSEIRAENKGYLKRINKVAENKYQGKDNWNKNIDKSYTNLKRAYNEIAGGARSEVRKSEAGRDTDKTASNVISVSRAAEQVLRNPKQGSLAALHQTAAQVSGAVQSEGGKVAGSVLTKTVSQAQNVAKLLTNPKAAPIKMVKSLVQTGVRSVRSGGRVLGRGM